MLTNETVITWTTFNHAAMPHLAITATILECDENAHTRKQTHHVSMYKHVYVCATSLHFSYFMFICLCIALVFGYVMDVVHNIR